MTLHITEIWGFSCLFHITMSDYQDFKVLFSFKCFRSENSLKLTLLSFTVIIPGTVDRPTESCDSDTGSDVHAPLRMNSDNSTDSLWFRHQLTSHQIKTADTWCFMTFSSLSVGRKHRNPSQEADIFISETTLTGSDVLCFIMSTQFNWLWNNIMTQINNSHMYFLQQLVPQEKHVPLSVTVCDGQQERLFQLLWS